MSIPDVRNHMGRKVVRIRELRGIKQDALATGLGITQQAVSKMEQSEKIEDEKLERIAEILGVSAEAIKNFNEETVFNNFSYDQSTVINYQHNPVEKVIELYERMIKERDNTIKEKENIIQDLMKK